MYFDKFPKLLYPYNINNKQEYKIVTDITRNMRVMKEVMSNITIYDEYDMQDGETIEMTADKVYGSPFYHWVIMIVNDRYDYKNDFVLSIEELEKYIETKYGFTSIEINAASQFNVNLQNNVILSNNHPFYTGDAVIYSSGTNAPIGGLVNNRQYYAIRFDDNQFALATTKTNSTNQVRINIDSLSTGMHSFKINNQYNVHHYEDENGIVVNEANENVYGETTPSYPVSNYEYESRLNEQKRRIKLISPQLLSTILKNFEDQI